MAEKKTATKVQPQNNEEELNLDTKVTVKNLADWDVTFARKHDGVGDIVIVANGQQRLSRNEVIAQVNDNNNLFIGTANGDHATVYIEDAATRQLLGFEEKDRPQRIFTEKLVKDLFALSQAEYETEIVKHIKTRTEKYALIDTIRNLHLNDYAKIVFATKYTGYQL